MYIIIILFAIIILLLLASGIDYRIDTFISNKNIVLIGDSMLNNSTYVLGGESVPDLLSKKFVGNTVYNFAKDGATISDCYAQLDKISTDLNNSNTYVVFSCGGNNILNSRVKMDQTAINKLFTEYSELVKSIKTRASNSLIYVLNLYTPTSGRYVSYHSAINQWNKLLEDNAPSLQYEIIKTSNLLVTDEDFAYNIEPSYKGGKKIADAIYNSLDK
jgi:hypothetical protein